MTHTRYKTYSTICCTGEWLTVTYETVVSDRYSTSTTIVPSRTSWQGVQVVVAGVLLQPVGLRDRR